MAEGRENRGMPRPNWEGVERFTPLPGEGGAPPEWRNVRHGLDSMDLLVDQKLGGKNPQGEVEWITNEQLLLQLSNQNTLRIRWNISEAEMERFGLTDPRVHLTIWRW